LQTLPLEPVRARNAWADIREEDQEDDYEMSPSPKTPLPQHGVETSGPRSPFDAVPQVIVETLGPRSPFDAVPQVIVETPGPRPPFDSVPQAVVETPGPHSSFDAVQQPSAWGEAPCHTTRSLDQRYVASKQIGSCRDPLPYLLKRLHSNLEQVDAHTRGLRRLVFVKNVLTRTTNK
jgi:hypothetical protein